MVHDDLSRFLCMTARNLLFLQIIYLATLSIMHLDPIEAQQNSSLANRQGLPAAGELKLRVQ
jgi:hypothetical protein